MMPLSYTKSGVETITTSIRELQVSVILVGDVISCFRFKSDIKLTNALFSGQFCNKLQLRSPKTIIGLLNVSAMVKFGFNSSSRQDTGQFGGL